VRRPLAALTLAAAVTAGCSADPGPGSSATALDVVATTPVVADFARTVGGDRVTVHQLIKPGVDPHDYEPSPADIQAVADADVVVKNGVGLEAWLDDTISAAGFDGPLVDTSQGVTLREGEEAGGEHGEEEHRDPHIWHDPNNAVTMVGNIEKALIEADPDGRSVYEPNASSYHGELMRLHGENISKINSIPAAQRKLVTNHDALGYYCAEYGLEFVGSIIPSFDSAAELSGSQLSALVRKIRQTGARAVFSEASLPPRTAETVAQEAGVEVVGGEDALFADGLGPEGSPGGTYLGAERHNTDTIVRALGGRV
jgi:zinc/manganese transport system substrate-binding protein